jgi:hypothetical protein
MAKLSCNDFSLEILFVDNIESLKNKGSERIFDVYVNVKDTHYCGDTTILYFTESEIKSSVEELCKLFQTLKEGKAGFYERGKWEAKLNYIEFNSDGLGHFLICGSFTKLIGTDNNHWLLNFSKQIDQTYFSNFIKQLEQEIQNL